MPVRLHHAFAVHPGPWLRTEIVEATGRTTVGKLAEHLGVTRQALSALLNGNAGLSANMALRFEKAYGVQADTLLRMQAAHDLSRARDHESKIHVERIIVDPCSEREAGPA